MDEELTNAYFTQACLNTIQATVNEIFTKSQENCPYVTGRLRSSAGITNSNPAEGQYSFAYNLNDSAPYVELIEKGGRVDNHYRRSQKTGQPYPVQGYNVEGKFFIKQALQDVLSGTYNMTVVGANQGSQGYYINI